MFGVESAKSRFRIGVRCLRPDRTWLVQGVRLGRGRAGAEEVIKIWCLELYWDWGVLDLEVSPTSLI
jgi:hypothetical protein